MTKPGPPPEPRVLTMIKGNPGKKPLNDDEPRPPDAKITCPGFLNAVGRAEWRRVMKMFGVMEADGQKLITEADRAVLAGYCQSWADLQHAIDMIVKHGDVYPIKNEDGTIKYLQQTPWVAMKNKALIALKQYAVEFGFTPSSRTRIQVENTGAVDPLEAKIFGTH